MPYTHLYSDEGKKPQKDNVKTENVCGTFRGRGPENGCDFQQ